VPPGQPHRKAENIGGRSWLHTSLPPRRRLRKILWKNCYPLLSPTHGAPASNVETMRGEDQISHEPAYRLLCRLEPDGCLKRGAAGITLPQVTNPASVNTLWPLGNVNALAALGAFNYWTRTRKSCDIARQLHWGPPGQTNVAPSHRLFYLRMRAAWE